MYISRYRLKENIFIILIFTAILEYQFTLVHTFFVDRLVKLVPILILILFFPNIRENKENIYVRGFSKVYLALILIMVCSTILNLNRQSLLFLLKYCLLLSIPFLLLYKVNPHYFSDRIIKFPILIGAILSVNSIVLWVLVYSGIEPNWFFVSSERISRIARYSYLWGDMHYALSRLGGISRACGFFDTPNRYGCFLLLPASLSFGYFILEKRLKYLIACVLCSITIFLTLSITAFLCFVLLGVFHLYFNILVNGARANKKHYFKKGVVGLLLGFLVAFAVFAFYKGQRDIVTDYRARAILRGGGTHGYQSLFHSFIHQGGVFEFNPAKPFGSGMATMRDGKLYTPQYGFVRWLVLLGYPGAIFFCFFIVYMFKVYVFPALLDGQPRIVRYVALAFAVQTIAEIQEGSWLTPYYLYTTAMLVLLKKYDFNSVGKNRF